MHPPVPNLQRQMKRVHPPTNLCPEEGQITSANRFHDRLVPKNAVTVLRPWGKIGPVIDTYTPLTEIRFRPGDE
jgi:hypothetical protein